MQQTDLVKFTEQLVT